MTASTGVLVRQTEITEPGVYDIADDVYHADPVPGGSLSNSGAKKLLAPNCPAIFQYEREHPPAPKDVFDFGHAAHKLVLGAGAEIVEVKAENWRTNKAKEAAAEARLAGHVPLLTHDVAQVKEMATAILAHPVASALLRPDTGVAEQSYFWIDEPSGIMRRARLDWTPNPGKGRMIIGDYKTAISADPAKFAKAAVDFGYHRQAPWYVDAVVAAGLAADPAFVFVVQEKSAPYLVNVIELDAVAMRIGREINRFAINIYANCVRTGVWPGYGDDVALVALPAWYEKSYEETL